MTRSPPRTTYDEDFFAWTQEQASALRRVPREAIGAVVDIEHVAEEIEDLGKRDLREVATFLGRLFEHLIKIQSEPASIDVPHWRAEALNFQQSASAAFTASMRQLLDLPRIWRRGRQLAQVFLDKRGGSLSARSDCPFALDDLLTEEFDIDAALAKLVAAPRPDGA